MMLFNLKKIILRKERAFKMFGRLHNLKPLLECLSENVYVAEGRNVDPPKPK